MPYFTHACTCMRVCTHTHTHQLTWSLIVLTAVWHTSPRLFLETLLIHRTWEQMTEHNLVISKEVMVWFPNALSLWIGLKKKNGMNYVVQLHWIVPNKASGTISSTNLDSEQENHNYTWKRGSMKIISWDRAFSSCRSWTSLNLLSGWIKG